MPDRERDPSDHLIDSMPCPRTDSDCPQGMVLEVDYHDADLEPLVAPVMRYRCQDCDLELPVKGYA